MTQHELAERAGTSRNAIAKAETGHTHHLRQTEDIAAALDVPPGWLAFGSDFDEQGCEQDHDSARLSGGAETRWQALPAPTAETEPPKRLQNADELSAVVGAARGELVAGRFVNASLTGRLHARTATKIAARLEEHVASRGLGEVYAGEIGILIRRNPDTVRGADIAFVSHQRLARASADGYLDVPPELVVEIISPNDRWTDMADKLNDYFDAGVDVVWILNPKRREISVFRSVSDVAVLGAGDMLREERFLPGLELPVSGLFPAP